MAIEGQIKGKSIVTPYTGLLIPAEHSGGTFMTPALDKFYRTSEKVMGRFSSIRFDQIDRSLVTGADVMTVRWAMLIESHNPVYTSELLNYFRADHEMAAFLVIWGYEELMHYAKLRSYLAEGGFVDLVDLDRELIETRAGPWGERERSYTPLQAKTFTTLQEKGTSLFYLNSADRTREPVLKEVFTTIGKDEVRHGKWYLGKAKEDLKRNPRGLEEIDQVLLEGEMPGSTFVARQPEYRAVMRSASIIGIKDIVAVLGEVAELIGTLHVLSLVGSREFRNKVMGEYNIDPGEIIRHFLSRRGNQTAI